MNRFSKKLTAVLLTLCLFATIIVVAPAAPVSAAYSINGGTLNSATFIIDPGHGGSDPGACSLGRQEAADVLNLSKRVGELIISAGESVAFTRVTDITQSLGTKCAIANAGNFRYFLSIHRNAGGGRGIETYYYNGLSSSSTSAQFATKIQNAMINTGIWVNRGVKSANFAVIRDTNMTAALVEVGFIDTASDNTIFANNFETIARSIASGMLAQVGKTLNTTSYRTQLDSPASVSGGTNAAFSAPTQTFALGANSNSFHLSGWTLHTSGIASVQYKVDSGSWNNLSTSLRTDVQNAIGGYSDYSNCGYSGTINYASWSAGSHTITIRATTKASGTYTVGTIPVTIADSTPPTISNVSVSDITPTGYTVSCTVTDNGAVARVSFPTWTTEGGQDDLKWIDGTISGSTASVRIKISDFNYASGVYATHIYAYDGSNNASSLAASDTTVPTLSYPSGNYFPITEINGSMWGDTSTIWNSSVGKSFTAVWWATALGSKNSDGTYTITNVTLSNTGAKNINVSGTDLLFAVHDGQAGYAAIASLEVGDKVTVNGYDAAYGILAAKAHVVIPAKFELKDNSSYNMTSENSSFRLRLSSPGSRVSSVAGEFKCDIVVVTKDGTTLPNEEYAGTGCFVRRLGPSGAVLDEAEIIVPGDIDGNGLVNTADYIREKQLIKGKISLDSAYNFAADINDDGVRNSSDYILIKSHCKGKTPIGG